MAEIKKPVNQVVAGERIRMFVESYGIAVRDGVLTPCLNDEKEIRKLFGLSQPSQEVIDDWAKTDGVRRPITLKVEGESGGFAQQGVPNATV